MLKKKKRKEVLDFHIYQNFWKLNFQNKLNNFDPNTPLTLEILHNPDHQITLTFLLVHIMDSFL